jgi:methionyl-tRNA formyltransferase
MDEGDIIDILEIPVDSFETSNTLFDKFGLVSGDFLKTTMKKFHYEGLPLTPQDDSEASYCKKIDKTMGQLDFNKSAEELFYLWKGLTPWPSIWTMVEDKRFAIERCEYLPGISEAKV